MPILAVILKVSGDFWTPTVAPSDHVLCGYTLQHIGCGLSLLPNSESTSHYGLVRYYLELRVGMRLGLVSFLVSSKK